MTRRFEPGGMDHCSEMKGVHMLIQHKVQAAWELTLQSI